MTERALVQISHHAAAVDYRRALLQAAAGAGAPSLHIQCAERTLRVVDFAAPEQAVEFDDIDVLAKWLRPLLRDVRPIVLTGLGGVVKGTARSATRLFDRPSRVYDVQDDLSYGARGVALMKFVARDVHWRALCGRTIVLNRGMRAWYPSAKWLDNASHLSPLPHLPEEPRLVYIGSIDRRLDLDLLGNLAQAMPVDIYGAVHEWAPELEQTLDRLAATCDLRYFGRYTNADLPDILRRYSIGLVPYRTSERITRHVNPDKIYHYLNAGLGVVGTAIPQCLQMPESVAVLSSGGDIERAAGDAMKLRQHWNWNDYTWSRRWQDLQRFF